MKVLMIGQLPVEAGGSYTNGVCNVVYELSKCVTNDVELVVYATNMDDSTAKTVGNCRYRGSVKRPLRQLMHIILHPFDTYKQWRYYIKDCKAPYPHRYDAYRDNIERLIKEEKPDVIHCMNLVQMAATYFANRKFHLPLILTLHGCTTDKDNENGAVIHLPDMVTGLVPQTMKDISFHGIPKEKTAMVPNGTDTSKFYYSEEERVKLRRELGVDDDTTVMLTIGSLSNRKGQLTMLEKLNSLPKEFKYLYLIIGKGEDEEKILSYIKENKMENRVHVIGYVANTDLYKYHSAADVYVHCSRSEGQALSEVEAYATDLKIAVNRDVVTTIITDTTNRDDYLVFDFDGFDATSFISWCSNHKRERHSRVEYDWKQIFRMYNSIYNKLINNSNA